MKHFHADEIHAWAEGKQIQVKIDSPKSSWQDCENPTWNTSLMYRVKPETIKYRLYSCYLYGRGTKVLCWTSDFAGTQKEVETTPSFIKWIAPEMEIELDV